VAVAKSASVASSVEVERAALGSSVLKVAAELRPRIDAALAAYTDFAAAPDRFGRCCPAKLREAMRYGLLSPGKRLRPLLALLAARACGRPVEVALPAACAVEMVHAYSLIHDDLPAMDDDDLRRGRPTCHKVYGEALAILAGDALLALAFDVLASDVRPAEAAARCCQVLARTAGATALVGGQVDDLAAEGKCGPVVAVADVADSLYESASREAPIFGWGPEFQASCRDGNSRSELPTLLFAIHARKTAAMLAAAVQLGGICAGASDRQLAAFEQFGHCLGLAFQIKDDLLDVGGQEKSVGKRLGKDSSRGKLTYPGLLGVEESQRRATQLIDESIAALTVFGEAASDLAALARYVVERDR
jgi:geranylgeranyl diphosphate synthase type II